MNIKTISFGDDGSPAADIGWLWINDHQWAGWNLEIVRADPPNSVEICGVPPELTVWTPDNPRHPFSEAQLSSVRNLRIAEDPRLALSRPVDLLVIGARGPGILKAMHLGSTAEWLLARPSSPIVVPRHGRRTQTVVVCADGSGHARAAVDALCAMPWAADLAVTVVGVRDDIDGTERAIDDASRPLREAGAAVTHRILSGDPTEKLVEFLDQMRPDLVVLGTRGLTGLRRAVLGSTATAIAHSGDHSILVACADPAVLTD